MSKKRNFKQEAKDWWNDNKGKVKVGVLCGLAGIGYGFIKGVCAANKTWIDRVNEIGPFPEEPEDELGLTESNCDDPELLELVKLENENA